MNKISTLEDLQKIKKNGEYILEKDIDCEMVELPYLVPYFSGKLNGNGYTIKNIIITDDVWGDEQEISLFLVLEEAEITNINFKNIIFRYDKGAYNPRVAALATESTNSLIEKIKVDVIVESNEKIPLLFSSYECKLLNNIVKCNGEDTDITKY